MTDDRGHEGPCKRDGDGGDHDDDVCKLGRYRGLCSICRPIVAAEQNAARAARHVGPPVAPRRGDIEQEIRDRAKQPKLSSVCRELTEKAEKLEVVLDKRKQATIHAQVVLAEFKDTLTLVSRVAQSLVNQSGTGKATTE